MKNLLVFFMVGTLLFTIQAYAQDSSVPEEPNVKMEYSQSIMQHLKNNWEYKLTPENKMESVVVNLKIDKEGKIFERKVVKNSNDEKLNTEVFKQLSAMEPFPKMPDEFGAEYIKLNYQFVPNALIVNTEDRKDVDKVIEKITK